MFDPASPARAACQAITKSPAGSIATEGFDWPSSPGSTTIGDPLGDAGRVEPLHLQHGRRVRGRLARLSLAQPDDDGIAQGIARDRGSRPDDRRIDSHLTRRGEEGQQRAILERLAQELGPECPRRDGLGRAGIEGLLRAFGSRLDMFRIARFGS